MKTNHAKRWIQNLALCTGLLAAQAQAQVQTPTLCPLDLLKAGSGHAAIAALKALSPMASPPEPKDLCTPKVNSVRVFGMPACVLPSGLEAMSVGLLLLEGPEGPQGEGTAIAALYLARYAEDRHKALEASLAQRLRRLTAEQLPARLARLPVQEHLSAAFADGDVIVTLQRPSDGMPQPWFTGLGFERLDRLDVTRRDLNSCK